MNKDEIVVLDLQLNTQELEKNMESVVEIMDGLGREMSKVASVLMNAFNVAVKGMDQLITGIDEFAQQINSLTVNGLNSALISLEAIHTVVKGILDKLNEPNWIEIGSLITGVVSAGSSIPWQKMGRHKGKYEKKATSLFGGTNGESVASDDSPASGIVGGMFAGMGDFSSMLPDEAMLESLSTVITKLKEGAAAWVTQTGAKLADKAVDLQIIALYAADYVKAFGVMIAQIAASTAAWVKSTAAKVASTAAEWAQIAATTAWNALCAVATTVTTAFGAAMAFLTSPIGLVVVAITALIAIIVLLVKNWDTVSAKAQQVWATIEATFSAAGTWFYQNVVTPVAGFFSGMWADFVQAASNAWAGVQAVFSTVAGFFGKIFSEAWAGVVKVFSAAGSIFTDIKNGIVTVFKSVVNGLIKGINSIIAIPFNGINGALTMVKNIKLLGLQPFSGLKTISIPQIPYLAQGAVLPANKPFLAVVGDQKHGTNIEAPLETIRQALAEVMAAQGQQEIAIRFTGDLAQLGRVLKPVIDRENRRVGASLVKGAY